jgi:hypothetical protein
MEKNNQSYNTTVLGLSPLRFATPELPQLALYLALTLLFFFIFNAGMIWNAYTVGGTSLNEIITSRGFGRAWHAITSSGLVAGLLWALLGAVIYMVIWFFRSITTSVRNDLVVASYVHPVTYKEYLFWRSLILRKLFFGLSFVTLLVYLYAGGKTMASLAHFAYWRLESGLSPYGYAQLTGAVLAGILLMHGFTLILKISLNFWQFIYRDL